MISCECGVLGQVGFLTKSNVVLTKQMALVLGPFETNGSGALWVATPYMPLKGSERSSVMDLSP